MMKTLIRLNSTMLNGTALRMTGAFTAATMAAIVMLGTPAYAQAPLTRSLGPSADFSKICTPLPQVKLTRDWSKWDKSQPVADPEEMYDAAVLYSEGGAGVTRDPVTARRLLEDLADRAWAGRGRAHYRLGKLLLDPIAGPMDPERAAYHLATASSMLNMDGSVLLAKLHEQGRISTANVAEAERLLRAASAAGNVDGIIGLARLQRSGRIGDVPQAATNDLVNLGMQTLYGELGQGKCRALFEIASILSDDALVPGGLTEGMKWFEAAARQGDPKASLALAEIYLQGRAQAAPELIIGHLARAAEAGEPRAMTVLGERLLLGDRAPRDVPKAVTWLERAGANADPEAYKLLARYYRGEFGEAANLPKAVDVLTRASALPGHTVSILVGLARLHAAGVEGQPDVRAALTFYRRAADRGDIGSLTEMAKLLLAHPQAAGQPEEPMRLLKEAAGRGNPEAMGVLAELYACSTVVAQDPAQADSWLQRAAEAGHARSINALASQTANDAAAAQRVAAALLQAAERGDRESMVLLSHAYRAGQGVAVDEKAAERWRTAALMPGEGRSRALVLMARKAMSGEGGARDEAAARALLEEAAQEGEPGAQLELGRLLIGKRGQGAEVARGVQLLHKAAASENPAAMLALADVSGEQLQPTGKTALEWRKAAADAGSTRAAITLASATKDNAEAARWLSRAETLPVCTARDMIDLSQAYHKTSEVERANRWLKRAQDEVQAGAKDPAVLFLIGRAMAEGVGGPAGKQEAVEYIKLSAAAGRTEAMRYLGRGYVSGQIGEQNMNAAVEWLAKALKNGDASVAADLARIAAGPGSEGAGALAALKESAESGFAPGMREFGRTLQLGFGVPAQPEAGAAWLRKAADAGDTGAMKELSRAYASGYGVELSANASTEWLRRAAEAGDAEAMYNLSLAMTLGFGTEVNAGAAQEWLKTAEGAARK